MISVIGLSLDIVGAAVLAWGPLTGRAGLVSTIGGVHVSAEKRARDRAFGFVGLSCLLAGFALQGLPYLGVDQSNEESSARIAAALTVAVGLVLASLAISALRRYLRAKIAAGESGQGG